MNPWWKIGLVLTFLASYGSTVWHVKAKFDEAAQEQALEDQIKDTAKKQQAIEQRAAQAETALAQERQLTATLNQKWSEERARKNHIDCLLPADTLGMLKDATGPAGQLSR